MCANQVIPESQLSRKFWQVMDKIIYPVICLVAFIFDAWYWLMEGTLY